MEKTSRFNVIYLFVALAGVLFVHDFWMGAKVVDSIAYSEFLTLVKDGKVKEIAITSNEIRGELK
ncbi:MAG TPA: ATP-dependent metallopeptidase FtsH/Yme1/Tma family protein, partial [Polyangiaceae bacterium]